MMGINSNDHVMREALEHPFAVFNTERFKRYGLLLAYRIHNAAEAVIERLEDEVKPKAKAKKRAGNR